MNARLRLIVLAAAMLAAAYPARADSGSGWTLAPDGRMQARIGTWQRTGGMARFQWLGKEQYIDVNLQQPTALSTPDVYVYVYVASESHGRGIQPRILQTVARGELALDLRTFNGQSIDGAWRKIETIRHSPHMSHSVPDVGPWQRVRFVIEDPTLVSRN